MTEYSKETSFWHLLKEKRIVIPIIQRDYAQGRIGKEYLRQRFLGQLLCALKTDTPESKLVLDFVYGSTEGNILYPLDGQQRLTTLWLLHWYLALRAGALDEDGQTLRNFSYETRTSSRIFCDNLCKIKASYKPETDDVVSFIRNQRWYYSSYDQDPTIQSMLCMLGGSGMEGKSDGIEKMFSFGEDFGNYLDRLKRPDAPVKFYVLNMEDKNMPLSDDLYIKMNARGKILTDFENFKADLLNYKLEDKTLLIREDDAYEESFRHLLDTKWTDIFWLNHSKALRIDEIFMKFINRFFLNWYIANCNVGSKPEDITSSDFYKSMTTKSAVGVNDSEYQNISVYKYVLTHECMQAFYTCMNNLHDLYEQIIPKDVNNEKLNICTLEVNKFFNPYWKDVITEDENNKESRLFYFIPKYIEENILTTITQQQRIVFHAVCVYLERCNKVDIEKLKDWMHFVWNIVENSYIDREQVVSAIRFFERDLDSLPHDSVTFAASQDILQFLAKIDPTQIKEVFGKRQLLEEISKAKKIDEDYCWKKKIHEAESFAFFNGSIAFLFNDIEGRMDDWGNFDQKMSVAKTLFDENGVKEERVVMALQTLYSYCSDWIRQLWWNARIFDGTSSTWKNNILNSVDRNYTYIYACPVHHILMGDNPSEVLHEYRSMRMLTDKALIEYIVKKNEQKREMYIRWPHDALYFCGDKRGVLLSNKFRDDSIAKLLNDGRFSLNDESIKIANTGLLWGFDINLVYHLGNGHDINLQWYREHNANNYDIYLMDENWNYRHRLNNLDNAEGDRRYYFCFNVIKETEDFIFTFIKQLKSEFAEILNGE